MMIKMALQDIIPEEKDSVTKQTVNLLFPEGKGLMIQQALIELDLILEELLKLLSRTRRLQREMDKVLVTRICETLNTFPIQDVIRAKDKFFKLICQEELSSANPTKEKRRYI